MDGVIPGGDPSAPSALCGAGCTTLLRVHEEPQLCEQDWGNGQDRDDVRLQKAYQDAYGHFFHRFAQGGAEADWTAAEFESLPHPGNVEVRMLVLGGGGGSVGRVAPAHRGTAGMGADVRVTSGWAPAPGGSEP